MKPSNQALNPLHDLPPEDAIGMLIADHQRVARLFAKFRQLTDGGEDEEKASLVEQICQELTVHTQLEEEIFYPAARAAIDDNDQVDEAVVEHAGAKFLIAQLRGADPDDDFYDAKVTVLSEQIQHHVEEEEGSLFPKARYSGLDTLELGATLLARKEELLNGMTRGDETGEAGGGWNGDSNGDAEGDVPPPVATPAKRSTAAKRTMTAAQSPSKARRPTAAKRSTPANRSMPAKRSRHAKRRPALAARSLPAKRKTTAKRGAGTVKRKSTPAAKERGR